MAPQHPIFEKPLKVNIHYRRHPTPKNYRHFPDGTNLGDTLEVWRVQTESPERIGYGIVANPHNFDSAPDAEIICSGLNTKAPTSVAIGRHGNFLLWGFAASPRHMTEEARRLFVNAVAYIHQFDREPPLVRVECSGRGQALAIAAYLSEQRSESEGDPSRTYLLESLSDRLRQRFEDDPERFGRHVAENLEFLVGDLQVVKLTVPDTSPVEYFERTLTRFELDEDAKSLGPSNRRIESLDHCIEMLGTAERAEAGSASIPL